MSMFCVELTQVGYEAATQNTPMVRHCCGYFLCDTAEDIPDQDEYSSDNIKLMIGSRAKVISTNSTYMMQQDGTWVIQDIGNAQTLDASNIIYDNTNSGMTATNVQDALDEVHDYANYMGTKLLRQGTKIPQYANLDDYTVADVYYCERKADAQTIYNTPWTSSGYKLLVWSISSTNKQQWMMPIGSTVKKLFIRNRTSDGWAGWFEFAGTDATNLNPYTPPAQLTSLNPSLLQGTNFNPEITSVQEDEEE